MQLARAGVGAKGFALLYIALVGVLLLTLYRPAWQISPYADDYTLMMAAEAGLAGGAYAGQYMFRPLELFVVQLSFALQGDPQFAKLVSFAAFLLSVGLLFWLAHRIQPSSLALPVVATALFAFHSIGVSAITQVDTVSQQFATLVTLALFGWYLFGPGDRPLRYHLVGGLLMLLAFASKEVSVGAVFALPVALGLVDVFGRAKPIAAVRDRALVVWATAGLAFAIYMVCRVWAGSILFVDDSLERYTLLESGPLNVVKNVVLLLGSVAYLGSTLELFLLQNPLRLLVSAALTLAFNGLALLGLIAAVRDLRERRADRQELALIGAAAVMLGASLFPIVITGWPSELHAYLPAPFYALVAGFLALRGWRALQRRVPLSPGTMNRFGIVAFAATCCWLALGASEKIAWAATVGDRSQTFLEQLTAWYIEGERSPGADLACVVEDQPGPVYSVFAMSSYSLIQPMVDWLNGRHGARLTMPKTPAATEQCSVIVEVDGDALTLRRVGDGRAP